MRFLKLPTDLYLAPSDEFYKDYEAEVVVSEGGFDRLIGGTLHFALLLRIINLRWFPDLSVGDDDNAYERVGKVLRETGLDETFKGEAKNYQQCWDLFISEYDRRCESDPFYFLR